MPSLWRTIFPELPNIEKRDLSALSTDTLAEMAKGYVALGDEGLSFAQGVSVGIFGNLLAGAVSHFIDREDGGWRWQDTAWLLIAIFMLILLLTVMVRLWLIHKRRLKQSAEVAAELSRRGIHFIF